MNRKTFPFLLIFSLIAFLTACAPKQTSIIGADRDAVIAYSEPMTDNLLAAINSGDYAAFSRDFDADMLTAMPESEFIKLKTDRDATLGVYVSREISDVLAAGNFVVIVYTAVFQKEPDVIVRVVFRPEEPHQISGLWFNK